MNVSVSIDGFTPSSHVYDNLCPGTYCYNISTITIRSLTYGSHTLDILVVGYNGTGWSDFYLDYVVIDTTDTSKKGLSRQVLRGNILVQSLMIHTAKLKPLLEEH